MKTHLLATLIFFFFLFFFSFVLVVSLDHLHFSLCAPAPARSTTYKIVPAKHSCAHDLIAFPTQFVGSTCSWFVYLSIFLLFLVIFASSVTRSLHQSLFFTREICRLLALQISMCFSCSCVLQLIVGTSKQKKNHLPSHISSSSSSSSSSRSCYCCCWPVLCMSGHTSAICMKT